MFSCAEKTMIATAIARLLTGPASAKRRRGTNPVQVGGRHARVIFTCAKQSQRVLPRKFSSSQRLRAIFADFRTGGKATANGRLWRMSPLRSGALLMLLLATWAAPAMSKDAPSGSAPVPATQRAGEQADGSA